MAKRHRARSTWQRISKSVGAVLVCALAALSVHAARADQNDKGASAKDLYQQAAYQEDAAGNLDAAIALYQRVLAAKPDRTVAARAQLRIGVCLEKLGKPEAAAAYAVVARDYADQTGVAAEARTRLVARGGASGAMSQNGLRQEEVWAYQIRLPELLRTPSPDGRYVAWLNYPGGKNTGSANLAVHDLLTGQDRDVTRAPLGAGFADDPYFTPDGRQLVYQWFDFKKDDWGVRMINIDGSNERTVFDSSRGLVISGPVSPDGRLMAAIVQQSGTNRQVAVGNLSTGVVTVLKTVEWRQPQLGNFSPDGKFIAYSVRTRQDAQDREVLAIAVDGSSEVRIAAAPGENRTPFFTPDGQHVVFPSNRSGRWDLWAVRMQAGKPGGAPEIVKADIGSVTGRGFSRDGTFFYHQHIDESDVYEVEVDPRTWRVAGAPKRLSDRFVHNSADAHWSPDGQALAYIAWRAQSGLTDGGNRLVVTRDLSTDRERESPVPMERINGTLRWFPDRKSLLFTDVGGGRRRFRQIDTSTGGVRTLLDTAYSASPTTTIAPDGRSFLFTNTDPASRIDKRVVRYEIDTREQKDVYVNRRPGTGAVAFHGFSTSPDGRRMAFKAPFTDAEGSYNWSLMLADLSGGEPRELWRVPTRFVAADQAVWDTEGRGLLVVVSDQIHATTGEIWWVPVDGGPAHPIGVAMPNVTVNDVHPDGRRLAFTSGKSVTHVWTLKNLFPPTRASR